MLFYCLAPQWVLAILPILFAIIPWTSSHPVRSSPASDNGWVQQSPSTGTDETSISVGKRNADPWGLCGESVHYDSTECFYIYLRIYARMRNEMRENSSPDEHRNIGKRGETSFGLFDTPTASRSEDESPEQDGMSERAELSARSAHDAGIVTCPKEWTLLECLEYGFGVDESLRG